MGAEAALTLLVLVVCAVVLVLDRYPPLVVLGAAVVVVMFAGVIEPEVALSGLSSQAPATVAALYVLAGAATATGAFGRVIDRLLDRGTLGFNAGVAAMSSVIANTPLVAMFAPRVVRWSQRRGVSPGRYLLPLSYAGLLGGVVTVIGTSTNIVVSEVLREQGLEPLGMFEITTVGLPVAVVGVIVLSTIGARLLPDRSPDRPDVGQRAREFRMAARIDPDGPLVGHTIAESGLRSLDGVFLAVIERPGADADDGVRVIPATPHTVLEADDLCCFVGDAGRVIDLHDIEGITSAERPHLLVAEGAGAKVFEAVVSPLSRLAGATLRSADFRARYGGAVMAVHRADGELEGQLGRATLRAGDVLLVLARDGFDRRWRTHGDFSLVAALDEPPPPRSNRAWLVAVAALAMIGAAASGRVSLFEAALAAALLVIVGGAINLREGWNAINLQVIGTMAVAISLGGAVAASGLAADAASLAGRAGGHGDAVLVLAVMLVTVVLTEMLTNTAAAALLVPVVLATAEETGADPRMLAIAVLIGASCSFLSPIGYQTNLMVLGLGGYRFTDYPRVGLPLTISTIATATVLLPWTT